ncbi:hypothetical protein G7Z17_g12935 [Cylindrodendrum hubeiense]|uniref:Uncharacterized protein n=1 Tax=Cylindrodendrum hubeiense TaxID=595255 RepID=A0A9P5GUJ4_9HYPO|nr:hypothetical protein G7Z17_g12935 [Cylindrodendrum hubeiense]
MVLPLLYGLAFAVFAPAVRGTTSFIRPPNFDKEVDENTSNNIRYETGATITVTWETDLDEITLAYVQQLANNMIQSVYLAENITTNRYTWEAAYDPAGFTKDDEDAVGWFTLNPPGDSDAIRGSQRFNVTAPKSDTTSAGAKSTRTTSVGTTSTGAVSTTSLFLSSETDTSQSTATSPPSSESTSPGSEASNSGLPGGVTAGIAVGALIGGSLFLGGAGFVAWKRSRKRRRRRVGGGDEPTKPQDERQQSMSIIGGYKAELADDPIVHPVELAGHHVVYPEFAKSQPGVHEAP